jgi:hypothetical protein
MNREIHVGFYEGRGVRLPPATRLARLEGHGLLQNTGRETQGSPYAWHLTLRGEEILRAGRTQQHPSRMTGTAR